MYHIILAGGSGLRFWPQSRKDRPKQLLSILDDDSMIRMTINRIKKIDDDPSKIFIVASEKLCKLIEKDVTEIPKENFIIEPSGKNTAPAIGLAALHIYHKDPSAVMGIYPSDHLIQQEDKFVEAIKIAEKMASEQSVLVTMGITPTYPATGYGYIQYNQEKDGDKTQIYKVKTFAEKPNLSTAEQFVESNEFLWNGGIFVWKAEVILLLMKTFMCELHDSLDAIYDSIGTPQYNTVLDREWELIQPQSIDYGILENAKNVYTVKTDFQWNDMGSWKSLFEVMDKNQNNNVAKGEVLTLDTKNSMIYSPDRLTAIIGMDNIAVVNLEDTTLIMPISEAEKVRDIVKMLESMNKEEYL
ncbi:MAG: mannose-1-phosphate guanylyltransferase [Candidatus Marinimicrobia bacterium]|nr:mannose-1-phosphate guanylyltransferase [Candidatus Neomarinimicrobiota bacterium]MBL7023548.1 mannose-1-phosphate guanylyltransferase [Candidatus Neomarinimicrobiota bacterium]MBL7109572.1 mannose-1-phosphate guanylyltransferase [Candidatus Neomarinimicrobiota bacterium]